MSTKDRELVFERILQAPRELVFDVWTDPRHLSEWYGPEGFSLTTHEMDLAVGGTWSYTMHGPDGIDYRNTVQFEEIERPERLVYRHIEAAGTEPAVHVMEITFDELGDKTRLSMRLLFDTPGDMQMIATRYGAVEGGNETINRLEQVLALLTNPLLVIRDNQIVSTRLIGATPEQVWTAWTDPVILASWWGPKGFTNSFKEYDLQPGGSWNFTMHGPDGKDYPNECIFIAINAPIQIIWRHFSQPQFYVIANFEKESGGTRVIFKMIFNSVEDCDKARDYVPAANEQNFDKLENLLGFRAIPAYP